MFLLSFSDSISGAPGARVRPRRRTMEPRDRGSPRQSTLGLLRFNITGVFCLFLSRQNLPMFVFSFPLYSQIVLEAGQMLMYESMACLHGRLNTFRGKFYGNSRNIHPVPWLISQKQICRYQLLQNLVPCAALLFIVIIHVCHTRALLYFAEVSFLIVLSGSLFVRYNPVDSALFQINASVIRLYTERIWVRLGRCTNSSCSRCDAAYSIFFVVEIAKNQMCYNK